MTAPAAALLGVAAVALAGFTLAGADRRDGPLPDREAFFDRWSALHGGYDPRASRWVRGWLALTWRAGAPLARVGVRPDALTLWGVWLAFAVVVAALPGGRWPLLAALLVVVSAAADGLDGCVAALTGGATRWGHVLDALADRVSDVAYLLALWLVGAPAWLAVAAGVGLGLLEYLRASAATAGMEGVGVITVGERPTRVVCATGALAFAGAVPTYGPALAAAWLAALALLAYAGLGQLLLAVRRALA